jgi:hypothetical protein
MLMVRSGKALAVAMLVATLSASVQAQSDPWVGNWQGNATVGGIPMTFFMVIGPNHQYSQQVVSGPYRTMQSGNLVANPTTITFQVLDWDPKTQAIYHPVGTTGGYYTQEPVVKPPGGTNRYQFLSPNSVQLQDVNYGGVIVFSRAQ